MKRHDFWTQLGHIHQSIRLSAYHIQKGDPTKIRLRNIYDQAIDYSRQYVALNQKHWQVNLNVYDVFIVISLPSELQNACTTSLQSNDVNDEVKMILTLEADDESVKYIVTTTSKYAKEVCSALENFAESHQSENNIQVEYAFALPNCLDEIIFPSNSERLKQVINSQVAMTSSFDAWRMLERVYGELLRFENYPGLIHAISACMCSKLLKHQNFQPNPERIKLATTMTRLISEESR